MNPHSLTKSILSIALILAWPLIQACPGGERSATTEGTGEGSASSLSEVNRPCPLAGADEGSEAAEPATGTEGQPTVGGEEQVAPGQAEGTEGQGAPGQAEGTGPLVQLPLTTPSVTIDPRDRVVYLVIVDRFQNGDPANDGEGADPSQVGAFHGGDFKGLTERVPYLADLGINTVWITPMVDQIDRPVNDGIDFDHWPFHGYWAEDFQQIEPRLGTATELAQLIQTIHINGMNILLDVVLNHPGYHSHFTADPAWTRSTEAGTCVDGDPDLTMCLFGLPDFRTDNPEVANQLIDWQSAWFANFPFDGLRADTVKHVEMDVWRAFLDRARSVALTGSEHFFALGEFWGSLPTADEPYLAEGMFDAFFDFEFYELVEGFVNGRLRAVALGHHLGQRNDAALGRYVRFLNSHDTVTMVNRMEDPRAYDLALALLLTSGGIPMLYYGDELGRNGGEWPNNRPDMPWDLLEQREQTPFDLTRDLLALRRAHPSLGRGTLEVLTARDGLLVVARAFEGERLIVAYNRGPAAERLVCAELNVASAPLYCHRCTTEADTAVTVEPFGIAVLQGL